MIQTKAIYHSYINKLYWINFEDDIASKIKIKLQLLKLHEFWLLVNKFISSPDRQILHVIGLKEHTSNEIFRSPTNKISRSHNYR